MLVARPNMLRLGSLQMPSLEHIRAVASLKIFHSARLLCSRETGELCSSLLAMAQLVCASLNSSQRFIGAADSLLNHGSERVKG